MQLFGEKEIDLIEDFKMTHLEEILIMSEDNNNDIEKVIELVKNIDKWIDSSGKDKVPPDFYNEENKITLNKKQLELYLNGVKLSSKNKDGMYGIYDENYIFIGIGSVQKGLLKREVCI